MEKLFSVKLWRKTAVIFLTLVIVFGTIYDVGKANASAVNKFLGISTSSTGDVKYSAADRFPSDYNSNEEITDYAKSVVKEVEGEGLVLIKNENNALPLSKGDKVSAVFQNSVNISYGASGSSAIASDGYIDLKTALENAGLIVNETLWNFYKTDSNAVSSKYNPSQKVDSTAKKPVYKTNTLPWSLYSDAAKNSIAQTGGTALVIIARASGEGKDVSAAYSDGLDGSYLSLTEGESEILKQLTSLKNSGDIENIVVILNTALAFKTDFVNGDVDGVNIDACMWIGNVGITGINAVCKALIGEINPSGKLSDTYVKDNFAAPSVASQMLNDVKYFSNKYVGHEALESSTQYYYGVYVEGIYVGYRYYETRYEDVVLGRENVGDYDYDKVVSYPFGHGLSYTKFEYSDYDVIKKSNGDYEVTVTVTNVGSVKGKEVVEVYLQKSYTEYDKNTGVEKASVELVGFAKTALLNANGGSETVKITVDKESLKTYDSYGYKTYILEEGDYYLSIGTSAHDALNNILALKEKSTADGMDYNGKAYFAKKIGEDITLDATTYSVSKETGATITNQLDFCDINLYETESVNQVTYLTRSNWSGTFPSQKVTLTLTDKMKEDLKSNKQIQSDGSSLPEYAKVEGVSVSDLVGLDFAENSALYDKLISQMTFAEQANLLSNAYFGTVGVPSMNLPQTKADDGPTGVSGATSTDGVSFPSEGIWASSFNLEVIRKEGDALAEEARAAGDVGMYLPGVNIHRNSFCGRVHEYFSEDAYLSGVACEAEIKGVQNKGVIPYVKHFVFNEQEDNRNGVGVWLNEQSARELYLKVYEYAVSPSKGNAHGVMSSFNRAGCICVGASSNLQQAILRGEFGFDGVILTDMASGNGLFYMTFSDAFMNGTDLFLGVGSANAFDDYAANPAFANKIRESAKRYAYVVANFAAVDLGKVTETTPYWQVIIVVLLVIFVVTSLLSVVLAIISYVKTTSRKTVF